MLFEILYWFAYHAQIKCLGEWCILSTYSGHVNDSFLESDDFTCCYYRHALEGECFAGAYSVYLGYHTRENSSLAFNLDPRLDYVLDRCDSYRLTWLCDVEYDILDLFIFEHYRLQIFRIDKEDTLLDLGFFRKPDISDIDLSDFQSHF